MPISLHILENIILASKHTKSSVYSTNVTQAMYALAFFAALRVCEITYQGNLPAHNIIRTGQIAFIESREGTVTALKLTLGNYKQSDSSSPVDIFIYRKRPVCPVHLLSEYINISSSSFLQLTVMSLVCFKSFPFILLLCCFEYNFTATVTLYFHENFMVDDKLQDQKWLSAYIRVLWIYNSC